MLIDCLPDIIRKTGGCCLEIIGPLSGAGLKDRPKLGFVKVLEKRVKKLHLQNAVRFWGGRFGEEKYRLLSRAHVFVNPSVHPGETLGLANIDALACGLPIVVTRWGGPEEVIKDGENGYRVDVHWGVGGKKDVDRERLVSGISEILNNNALAKRMGRNSRRIAKRFDVRTAMPRLARILAKASKMPRTPGRWVAMKDKTPFDFRDIFRPEMLFFLPFSPGVHQTYESLWKQYQQRVASRVVPLSPRSMLRPLRPCESSVFKNVRIELAKYLRGSL